MKTLFLDIEIAPALVYTYGRYDVRICPDQVVHNGFILCYQAAWNDGPVFTSSLRDIKKDILWQDDDKDLVIEASKLISEADVVVGHNAIKFDLARISARLASHNLPPFAPAEVVDTLRECRRKFMFEANSLDSVCQELGIGRKGHSGGYETAIGCMHNKQDCWDKLLEYGEQDVVLLRELYYRIRPWARTPNQNLYDEGGTVCPKCSGLRLQYRGHYMTKTMRYHRFQCLDCGSWGKERTHNLDKEKRDSIVVGV